MQTQLLVLSNLFNTKTDKFDIISKRLEELYDEIFSIEKEKEDENKDLEVGLNFLKK